MKDHEEQENQELRERMNFSTVLRRQNTAQRVAKVAQLQAIVR